MYKECVKNVKRVQYFQSNYLVIEQNLRYCFK